MNEKHLSAHIGQYALIKNDENKILILERARSKTWCLPGGRLNEDDDWDSALLREIKEELGIECYDPKPQAVNVLKDAYQTKYSVYFSVICSDISKLKISSEHSDLGWFGYEEVKDMNIEDDKIKTVILDYLK
ncbi:MAG: NUDIX hydrolase [Candidatus Saccharibacteria bacterium]